MRWFLAIVLIFLGIIFLGSNFNWWPQLDWSNIWQFWPLILIWWGASLIFRKWHYGWVVMLIIFILSCLFIFNSLISSRPILFKNISQSIKTSQFQKELSNEFNSAQITLETQPAAIELVNTNDHLISGSYKGFGTPNLKMNNQNGQAIINLSTVNSNSWQNWGKNNLSIEISDQIPIDLKIITGASSLKIDCRKIILSNLDIQAGASSINLKIGPNIKNNSKVTIKAGASSINIDIPKEIGVKILAKTGLSSKNFSGFTKIDNENYQSLNYDQAQIKIDLSLEAGVSSININQD